METEHAETEQQPTSARTGAPAAIGGDGYVRNVEPGASCDAPGARGFTPQLRLTLCATTATDPHPRWRTP